MFTLRANRLSRAWRSLLGAALLATGIVAHAKATDASIDGELLVQLRSTAALRPLLTKYQLTLVDQFGARPIYRLKVVGAASVDDKIDALLTELDVLQAEPNYVHRSPEARKNVVWTIGTPQAYAAQWAPQALRLAEAHRLTQGAGIKVAVLDTGVDARHPALAGRLLPGFDFVDFDTNPAEVGSVANLSFGHGTHVAGLVALAAPAARIMPLRVLDAEGAGNAWVIAEAMLHAVDPDGNPATNDGVQVINLSLGSTGRTHIFDTVAQVVTCSLPAPGEPAVHLADPGYNGDKSRCSGFGGAVVIAAAGNSGSDSVREYPAAESAYGLLSVGASNAGSRRASFSNYGSKVAVAAPGEAITSSVPGGGFGTWSGTSMAAPLAAGVAALVRARSPGLSARDVERRIARRSAALCGTDLRQVDAVAAITNQAARALVCR